MENKEPEQTKKPEGQEEWRRYCFLYTKRHHHCVHGHAIDCPRITGCPIVDK